MLNTRCRITYHSPHFEEAGKQSPLSFSPSTHVGATRRVSNNYQWPGDPSPRCHSHSHTPLPRPPLFFKPRSGVSFNPNKPVSMKLRDFSCSAETFSVLGARELCTNKLKSCSNSPPARGLGVVCRFGTARLIWEEEQLNRDSYLKI